MSERLSAELISHADFIEQDMLEDRTAEERAGWVKHQRLVDLVVEAIVSTRETLRAEDLSVFDQFAEVDPDLTESLLDEYYTRAYLNDIARIAITVTSGLIGINPAQFGSCAGFQLVESPVLAK